MACAAAGTQVAPGGIGLPRGVIGNTLGSGPRDSWFEPRRGNWEGMGRWVSEREVRPSAPALFGRVAERSKAHAWRACGRHKRLVGSNPTPSVRGRRRCRLATGRAGGAETSRRCRGRSNFRSDGTGAAWSGRRGLNRPSCGSCQNRKIRPTTEGWQNGVEPGELWLAPGVSSTCDSEGWQNGVELAELRLVPTEANWTECGGVAERR
jgi:hypothetical protein